MHWKEGIQVQTITIACIVLLFYPSGAAVPTNYTNISEYQTCFPKSWNVLIQQSLIIIEKNCGAMKVLRCGCLTLGSKVNNSGTSFGRCFYGCFQSRAPNEYYEVMIQTETHEDKVCFPFNRKDLLCGQCEDGYAPAAYSFNLKCVKCGNETHWTHIAGYILAAMAH